MTFEKWCKDTYGWPAEELCHKDGKDLEAAWQAATLAERERAAGIAESRAHFGKPCCRNHADEIKDTIRKGEGI